MKMESSVSPDGTDEVVFEEGHVVVGGDAVVVDFAVFVHHHEQIEQVPFAEFFDLEEPLFELFFGGGVGLVDALLHLQFHEVLDDAVAAETDLVDQVHDAVVHGGQDHLQVDILTQHVTDFI